MESTKSMEKDDTNIENFPELWYDIVEENHFWFYWRFKTLLKVIKSIDMNLFLKNKAFDIGSGNALLINQLEQCSEWVIDGCDINPKFVEELHIRGKYFKYDIFEKREELKGKYDCIFLFDILEHLNEPRAFLEAASYYLKKNGVIFINVPAFLCLYGKYDKAVGHKMRYNRKSVKGWLTSDTFIVEDFRYWGMLISPLVLIRKLFTSFSTDETKIVTRGMKTPGKIVNNLLKKCADIETFLIPKPPFGCSLMLTLRKK